MLLMSQGRQQKADLAFHFVRSAYDELNFLPYQLGMAPAQSMHRRPDRAVAKVQAPGHLVVRAGFPVARQEPLQPGRTAPLGPCGYVPRASAPTRGPARPRPTAARTALPA